VTVRQRIRGFVANPFRIALLPRAHVAWPSRTEARREKE
jgi:hypothetical protein